MIKSPRRVHSFSLSLPSVFVDELGEPVIKLRRFRRLPENRWEAVRHSLVGVHLDVDASILQSLGVGKAIISENIMAAYLDHWRRRLISCRSVEKEGESGGSHAGGRSL